MGRARKSKVSDNKVDSPDDKGKLLLDGATLDQVQMFVAAVDEGSFSAAGRKLSRVQSAVSYGIANLEEAIGVQLFDRSSRSPHLTPEGEGLLIEARALLDQMRVFHARASSMRTGLEPEVFSRSGCKLSH